MPLRRLPPRGRRVAAVYGPALAVAIAGLATFLAVHTAADREALVEHTQHVRLVIDDVQDRLAAAEASVRDLAILGPDADLSPYSSLADSVQRDLADLRQLTRDNPRQQQNLDALAPLIAARLEGLDSAVQTVRVHRNAALRSVILAGKALTGDIDAVLSRMDADEERLLAERQLFAARQRKEVTVILIFGTLFALSVGLLVNTMLDRQSQAIAEQKEQLSLHEAALIEQNQELQELASELEQHVEESQALSEELEQTNQDLQQSVVDADSARKEAETARGRAEEANRAKAQFLAAMSHELRTPLNVIGGHLQLIEMGVHGPITEAQREGLVRAQRSQRHLLSLITDLLNFARLEAGRVQYTLRAVPLASVVTEVTDLLGPQFTEKQFAVHTDVPPDIVVHADADKVQQILLNLLSNAIKFTESGGSITVEAVGNAAAASSEATPAGVDGVSPTSDNGFVLLRVKDTGIGVPATRQASIFDPFVQLQSTRSGAPQGTGLGLAISRELARGMSGDVRVESQEGQGSTFTLVLPTPAGRQVAAAEGASYS